MGFNSGFKGLITVFQICIKGPGSVVGIATGYGLDGLGIESPQEARFSAPVQSGPGAHTASCTMGTRSFLGVKSGPGVTLTPHPLLVPLVMEEQSYTSTPPMGRTACTKPQCLYKGVLYLYILSCEKLHRVFSNYREYFNTVFQICITSPYCINMADHHCSVTVLCFGRYQLLSRIGIQHTNTICADHLFYGCDGMLVASPNVVKHCVGQRESNGAKI